jgi:hypothetical protein
VRAHQHSAGAQKKAGEEQCYTLLTHDSGRKDGGMS